jgi:REP element-mobilizing transposase RayT
MRHLRELKRGVWYEIHTAINNGEPLFQSRQTLKLFAKVLDDTAARFDFEMRGLCMKDDLLVFRVKPADGLQLPRIMQWLKQTFAVRYNVRHKRSGHIWGDRYRSSIAEDEPPGGAESRADTARNKEAELLSAGGGGRLLSWKVKVRVRPLSGKPAKIPRKAASPPA